MNAMDCQLEQYAKDFQALVSLHRDLEQRYEQLSISHRQLAGAGEVLRSMSPRTHQLCLVTNLEGDIVQATQRARALFEQAGEKMAHIQLAVDTPHLPQLDALLKSQQTERAQASTDTAEILLNPSSEALNGETYAMYPLMAVHASTDKVYWFIREQSKREHSGAARTGAIVFDAVGNAVATDAGFQSLVDCGSASMEDFKLSTFRTPEHATTKYSGDVLGQVCRTGQWQGEISNIAGNRLAFRQWMSVSAIQDADGQVVACVAQLVDREKMLMAERLLLDAHYHDPITGLPNRRYFKEQVAQKIAVARQAKQRVALFAIMLDRHKWIHDTHDTAVSDAVVMKMGERLLALTHGGDILARTDDDQFLLLLTRQLNDAELVAIATHMIKALSGPVTIQQQTLQIGASIGCAMFPLDGPDLPTLTKNAESMMRMARKAGGNRYCLFKHSPQPMRAGPSPPPPAKSEDLDQCDIPTLNMELGA